MEKTFNKVRSTKDIVISAGLAAGGCVLVALPTSTSINILGFFMLFAGILLFLMLRSGYKEVETGENSIRQRDTSHRLSALNWQKRSHQSLRP